MHVVDDEVPRYKVIEETFDRTAARLGNAVWPVPSGEVALRQYGDWDLFHHKAAVQRRDDDMHTIAPQRLGSGRLRCVELAADLDAGGFEHFGKAHGCADTRRRDDDRGPTADDFADTVRDRRRVAERSRPTTHTDGFLSRTLGDGEHRRDPRVGVR